MAVYKSNFLVEQPYSTSLCAQRVLYNCLSMAYQANLISETDIFEIDVVKYSELYSISIRKAYSHLKQAAVDLKHSDIHIPKENEDKTRIISWVSEIIYKDSGHFLAIKWHPAIIPYISGFQLGYTPEGRKIWKGNVTKLEESICKQQSPDIIRLYELLKKEEWKGTWKVSIEELRRLLHLDETSYPLYANLKQRIIVKGISTINELTRMNVKYLDKKFGKKVVGIEFIFR